MDKMKAKKVLCSAAAKQGLKVQMRAGKTADDIRILNASTGKVVASGTIALDASKEGYKAADISKTVNQINTKLAKNGGKRKMNSSRRRKMNAAREYRYPETDYSTVRDTLMGSDDGYEYIYKWYLDYIDRFSRNMGRDIDTNADFVFNKFCDIMEDSATESEFRDNLPELYDLWGNASRRTNSSRRRKMNAGCHSKRRINASDDEYTGTDAEFVEDVESIVTDEQGNEVVVDDMLVVQDPETNEISLFVPTEEDEAVPENVEVIGEVTAADDTVLDSSRRVKTKASRRK